MPTPQESRVLPPSSLRSVKGRLCLAAKALCESTESLLMPTTVAPTSVKSSKLSRNEQASLVHPGVSSAG